jgi:putative endonuclease
MPECISRPSARLNLQPDPLPFRHNGLCVYDPSQKRGTIYIGVTNDLGRRIPEHKAGKGSRFTAQYGVHRLV